MRWIKRLDGGDLRIVDVAEDPGGNHAVSLGASPLVNFDQAAPVDRVAERLAYL